jgi:protease IV
MSEQARKKPLLFRLVAGLWALFIWSFRILVMVVVIAGVVGWLSVGRHNRGSGTVEDNIALVLAPTGEIVEQLDQDPAKRFAEEFNGDPPSQTVLRELIEALDLAKDDHRIATVVLKLDHLEGAGLAQLEELNAAIDRFRTSGKPVHAYAPSYGQAQYFVAAHADDIAIDPLGAVEVEGLSSYQNYFKDGLDKLGVTVNVFRVGEYKSAVEPFIRNDMSPEAKQANRDWLGDLWARYGALTGQARQLPADAVDHFVRNYADALVQAGGDTAKLAEAAKLVTHIETLQQFRQRLIAKVGEDDDLGSFRQIWFGDYLNAIHTLKKPATSDDRIALVVVQGEIIDGDSQPGQAGGDTIYDLLDQARRDDGVQAVVLRVNSPGGSVFASEQIRRGVEELRAAGKPVVASMSSVAASGGYWISMQADRIIAHESTITGSIGIFGLVPTFEGPLSKLGIHTDGVSTTPLAGAMRIDRPLTPETKVIVQASIDKGYRDFIGGVAAGRKLDVAAVDKIARGRVWSGLKAQRLGLVDDFGGLEVAVREAAKLAQLQEGQYQLDEIVPEGEPPLKSLMRYLSQGAVHAGLAGDWAQWLAKLDETARLRSLIGWMNDPRGEYARCFCSVELGGTARLH